MASEIDICNLALSHLGDSATVSSISPPEGSAQAEHCARFYPIARDVVLEAHEWSFAMRRITLAQSGTPPSSWPFSYARPASCIRVAYILGPDATDDQTSADFLEEADLIYTSQEAAIARYITRVTDTTKFTPMFANAVSWLLASYLVGPLLKGDKSAKQLALQGYQIALAEAKMSNSMARQVTPTHNVPWMASR